MPARVAGLRENLKENSREYSRENLIGHSDRESKRISRLFNSEWARNSRLHCKLYRMPIDGVYLKLDLKCRLQSAERVIQDPLLG